MTFQPVIPLSGYTGWRFLQRTLDTQQTAFSNSAPVARATDTFREKISEVRTAADLMADRELLQVALGAFGLDDDIGNTYFIQKVLEEGTLDEDALANKLSDSRYGDLAKAFGFGDFDTPRTVLSTFADEIIDRYEARQFERAVGDQDNTMRLALNTGPALADITASGSNNAQWFSMMGNAAMRTVFEGALGFPSSFGAIDLDQQLTEFKARAQATFGTDQMSEIASEESQEKLIRLYMLRTETSSAGGFSSGSVALSLLQSAGSLY
ncbi:DUF1217 domain-containing protein [Octadecabacter sp. R77987]|uniref:DUF1217 domain-containing protein n=1 Tax=Octadecabacter sp. R77987 TaxID=3093874 RepID=UPI00367182C8